MISFERDQANGDYLILDTNGETRRFPDQPSWLYESLVLLLQHQEKIEAEFDRMMGRNPPAQAEPAQAA